MDRIRQAVELAREAAGAEPKRPRSDQQLRPSEPAASRMRSGYAKMVLNLAHLEANRIIAHDRTDVRSRSFDMLRTQVLQSMDSKTWQLLAVTSPTPGCGKTVTAINLALSIARQPQRSVLLIDLDIENPQVANYLGVPCNAGLLSVLEGRISLENALVQARLGDDRLMLLPCEESVAHSSSEYMMSRAMSALLQEITNEDRSRIVILDLPPILAGDNVISILPQIDCVLFVAAVGTTTTSEIKECNKHLQNSSVVRIVLNKASELGPMYY